MVIDQLVEYNNKKMKVTKQGPIVWFALQSEENPTVLVQYFSTPKPGMYEVYFFDEEKGSMQEGSPDIQISSKDYFTKNPVLITGFDNNKTPVDWKTLEIMLSPLIKKEELDTIVQTFNEFLNSEEYEKL